MQNWAKSVQLSSKKTTIVSSPKEISDIIKLHQKVKAVGSGMSYLGIAQAEGVLLDVSMIDTFIGRDGHLVTFGAGATLEKVVDCLLKLELQLVCCPGVLLTQTLGGAIATGTHGQDLVNGGIYDAVCALDVVLADGSIRHFTKTDPEFDAFRLHLGCLGIITHVTLMTEQLKTYRLSKGLTTFDDLVHNFFNWNLQSRHTKAWWFPKTGDVQVWRTTEALPEENEEYVKQGRKMIQLEQAEYGKQAELFSKSIDVLVKQMDEDTAGTAAETNDPLNRHKARFDTVTRFRNLQHCVGNMYQLWCKGIPAPQVNCEIAIPMEKLPAALMKLQQFYKSSEKETHYPFILRATGPSKAWLSPAYGRTVCYIGFLVYLSEDYRVDPERLQMLREIEQVLAEFDAVPHYGKFFTRSLYSFKELPMFHEFKRIRKVLDPHGKFLNNYVKDMLDLQAEDVWTNEMARL